MFLGVYLNQCLIDVCLRNEGIDIIKLVYSRFVRYYFYMPVRAWMVKQKLVWSAKLAMFSITLLQTWDLGLRLGNIVSK